MSTSAIDIANFALSMLGEQSIRSFSEDNSRARLCKNMYDLAVRVTLSRLDWSFARWMDTLNEVVDHGLPLDEGLSAYQKPANCVTPLNISPFIKKVDWEAFGDYLITRTQEDLRLVYTRKETNPDKFPETFQDVVAKHMTATLAGPLTGADRSEIDSLMQAFEYELTIVSASDANIGTANPDPDEKPENDTFNNGTNGWVDPYAA